MTDPTKEGSTPSTEAVVESKFPFYTKWWFWGAIAGGVAVIGTGTYFLVRR